MSMNSKERIRMLLSGEIPDRIGRADAPWPETRARWRKEGLPADVHASDHFKMDIRMNTRVICSFLLEEKVLEETDDYQIVSDADGAHIKYWKGKSGVPMPLKHAISGREDWERLKERLVPDEHRFAFGYYGNYMFEYNQGTLAQVKAVREKCTTLDEIFEIMEVPDPYEFTMAKMGDENVLMKMAMEPELLKEIFEAYEKLVLGSVEMLFSKGYKPDGVFIGGDIAYKNGLLFSPQMYREMILPHLKNVVGYLKNDNGLRVVYHSDGNPTEAIPMLLEAGVDCLEPLEVNAGMDVRKLAGEWGDKVAFMGNISVQAMSGPKDKLKEEVVSKIEACKKARARFIIHSDHSVPDTVPLENFQYMMELVDKYGKY